MYITFINAAFFQNMLHSFSFHYPRRQACSFFSFFCVCVKHCQINNIHMLSFEMFSNCINILFTHLDKLTLEIHSWRCTHPYQKMQESCKVGKRWKVLRNIIRLSNDIWFEYRPRILKGQSAGVSKKGNELLPLRGA